MQLSSRYIVLDSGIRLVAIPIAALHELELAIWPDGDLKVLHFSTSVPGTPSRTSPTTTIFVALVLVQDVSPMHAFTSSLSLLGPPQTLLSLDELVDQRFLHRGERCRRGLGTILGWMRERVTPSGFASVIVLLAALRFGYRMPLKFAWSRHWKSRRFLSRISHNQVIVLT